jgi:hypothetical protein
VFSARRPIPDGIVAPSLAAGVGRPPPDVVYPGESNPAFVVRGAVDGIEANLENATSVLCGWGRRATEILPGGAAIIFTAPG